MADAKVRVRAPTLLMVVSLGVLLTFGVFFLSPPNPVAVLQVVDAAGRPVPGAVIQADGLRTKPGPYESGHYGWRPEFVPNRPVTTDAEGQARVPYPRFVFERIETGQISFSVDHPDFVPDRPFRTVTTRPPAGAPWRVWVEHVLARLRIGTLIARPEPVVLQQGGILRLVARDPSGSTGEGRLFAQVSGGYDLGTNSWERPEPGVLVTRRLPHGPLAVRLVRVAAGGDVAFGDVVTVHGAAGQTNEVFVDLSPGVTLRGDLDPEVPRPIRQGRVVVHVWPQGHSPADSPPQWHAWAEVQADGRFVVPSLPAGDLEVLAFCDGFITTNGPGEFPKLVYPQRHVLGTHDLEVTLGMEATASLAVQVLDDQGKPLEGARVATWPNVRYGEWSATIVGTDLYNTLDLLTASRSGISGFYPGGKIPGPVFQATSDAGGSAVISNLPVTTGSFSVEHPRYVLPAAEGPGGEKHRIATMTLTPGGTHRAVLRLEPRGASPIAHY